MKIAAGHESKHKAAMSKAGDVVVVIPISTGYINKSKDGDLWNCVDMNWIRVNSPRVHFDLFPKPEWSPSANWSPTWTFCLAADGSIHAAETGCR